MAAVLDPPLAARTGSILKVLAICRISTLLQDERSLDDQEALYRCWLDEHTDLQYELTVISGQGSGEEIDRLKYLQAIERVESDQFDLVICEDLGRICRRVYSLIFCETCQDNNTRLIAINDHVDTDREEWRLHSYFAAMRHEVYNNDTAKRIRRTLRNRFAQGGDFQCPIYGYVKPAGANGDADVTKPRRFTRSGSGGWRTAPPSPKWRTG
jgi:DNA invertase Pin-like site-specific DNA recombinase